ncbi:MAG TPA: hypothetical protein VLS91_07215 [Acidimicrobiales bacterium]|nr:hypothetical protein [Acidimicrobiales bacterium]
MGKASSTVEQAVEAAREQPAAFVAALLADSLERAAVIAEGLEEGMRSQPLRRLERLWKLSRTEVANAFGVTRQAYAKWLKNGVPADRVGDVGLLDETTSELLAHIKTEKIADVVRRPAKNLDGKSLVDLLESGEFGELRDAVSRAFDLRRVQP